MSEHLQPKNATLLEKEIMLANDPFADHVAAIDDIRNIKFGDPIPSTWGPFVAYELGLGSITPYFNDYDDLVAEGWAWQNIRGTPAAITMALDWIGYDNIAVYDRQPRRTIWNRYQIKMGEVPEAEFPVLMDAEFLSNLSDPARSYFFRGWEGYNIPIIEWSRMRWGFNLWGTSSGRRLTPDGTVKWSHGEDDEGGITASPTEIENLGLDIDENYQPSWTDVPWNAPGLSWSGVSDVGAFRAFLVMRMPAYIGFYTAGGQAIGYRRVRRMEDITAGSGVDAGNVLVEYECLTGFGDGLGQVAASCSLVLNCRVKPSVGKPGLDWVLPAQIEALPGYTFSEMKIGSVAVAFTFRQTVRQRVTLIVEV